MEVRVTSILRQLLKDYYEVEDEFSEWCEECAKEGDYGMSTEDVYNWDNNVWIWFGEVVEIINV